MKIAYILKMYPRFSETFIVNEIVALEKLGVDIRIYSLRKPDDGRFHAKLAQVKAQVVYVPNYPQLEMPRIEAAHQQVAQAFPERYAATRCYTERRGHDAALKRFLQAGYVAGHLLANPVDAVHAHFATSATRVANLVWRMTGVPYSVTTHAKDIFHESVNPGSLRGKLRDARFVATVSAFNHSHLTEIMGDTSADIRTLYNGIDLRHFRPPTRPTERPRILAVGRLIEKKGFHHLIDACALLRDRGRRFECHIIGKGEWHDRLQAQIKAHRLSRHVKLLGAQPQDKVRAAYRRARVFALPCVIGRDGNRDGLPTVMLEAIACGLPVVSTPVTGNPEIVDDGVNGRLVPVGDAAALADALEQILGDANTWSTMSQAARRKAEDTFDIRIQSATLYQWLSEPLPAAPAPGTANASQMAPLPTLPLMTMRDAFDRTGIAEAPAPTGS